MDQRRRWAGLTRSFGPDRSYGHASWNEHITLSKRPYTFADLINSFSFAGLRIERVAEPQLSQEDRRRFPHKAEWMDRHLGILIFVLRPVPV